MKGKRVPLDKDGHLSLADGDYGRTKNGEWMCRPPGQHIGSLRNHTIEEHPDGTITVSPSILHYGIDGKPAWHGFLERGVWREV